MKVELIKSDSNYRDAVNYDGTNYYNFPCTVLANSKKLIVGFGTGDRVSIENHPTDTRTVLVGENSGLGYISCIEIDYTREFPEIIQDVFIDNVNEMEITENIFDLDTSEQIKILSNWFE